MIKEKILLFANPDSDVPAKLKTLAVDTITHITERKIPQDIDSYHVIIVQSGFCGNTEKTANFVRSLRKRFFNPIIGYALHSAYAGLFPLQLAGCNFIYPDTESRAMLLDLITILADLEQLRRKYEAEKQKIKVVEMEPWHVAPILEIIDNTPDTVSKKKDDIRSYVKGEVSAGKYCSIHRMVALLNGKVVGFLGYYHGHSMMDDPKQLDHLFFDPRLFEEQQNMVFDKLHEMWNDILAEWD